MSYWVYDDIMNNSPSLPGCVQGEETVFTMVYRNDVDTLAQSHLCVLNDHYVGFLHARLLGSDTWLPVMAQGDPECYLGSLPVGDTSIEFKFENFDGSVSFEAIQVFLFHDGGVSVPCPSFVGDWWSVCWFWADCWPCADFWMDDFSLQEQDCSDLDDSGLGGFEDSLEPQQFEDSYTPGQWV